MTRAAKKSIPPAVLLAADENQIIAFLTESHTQGRRFNISSIAGLDTLSPQERDVIGTKLT